MSEDYKARVQRAMENHHKKLLKDSAPKRKNQKPERNVQDACLAWMRGLNWDVQIYEAKATFDPRSNVWRNQAMPSGTCDCMGIDDMAHAVFIEFKAPGRRSSFNSPKNYKQKRFITEKIQRGAFAVVVDSVEVLQRIYFGWLELKNKEQRIQFLLAELP